MIFTVTFLPKGTGPRTAPLDITANGQTFTATLTGTGKNAPSLSINPTTAQSDGSRPNAAWPDAPASRPGYCGCLPD